MNANVYYIIILIKNAIPYMMTYMCIYSVVIASRKHLLIVKCRYFMLTARVVPMDGRYIIMCVHKYL